MISLFSLNFVSHIEKRLRNFLEIYLRETLFNDVLYSGLYPSFCISSWKIVLFFFCIILGYLRQELCACACV